MVLLYGIIHYNSHHDRLTACIATCGCTRVCHKLNSGAQARAGLWIFFGAGLWYTFLRSKHQTGSSCGSQPHMTWHILAMLGSSIINVKPSTFRGVELCATNQNAWSWACFGALKAQHLWGRIDGPVWDILSYHLPVAFHEGELSIFLGCHRYLTSRNIHRSLENAPGQIEPVCWGETLLSHGYIKAS